MALRFFISFLLIPLPASSLDREVFEGRVLPFVENHCLECHDALESEGGIDLEPFFTIEEVLGERDTWTKVLKQLRAAAMPPDGEPRPGAAEQEEVIAWLEEALIYVDPDRPVDPGRVTARRLNKDEYNRTIRDLFGITLTPADEFPDDDVGYGFDNIGDVLSISPLRMEQYLKAAETVTRNLFYRPDELPLDHTSTVAHYDKHDRKKIRNSSDRGLEMIPGGQVSLPFNFPVAGEYEILVQAWGVEKPDPENKGNNERWLDVDSYSEMDAKAPPVAAGEVFLGDRSVGRFQAPEGNATVARKNWYRIRFDTPPGRHRVFFRHDFVGGTSPKQRAEHLADPARAPRIGIRNITLRGPIGPGEAPLSPLHHRILDATPADAEGLLREVARRAFRRPVTDEELSSLTNFVSSRTTSSADFSEALELGLQAILLSPHFLYRLEWLGDPEATDFITPVGDHALASRLSYFLWSSMPDEELRQLADAGELGREETLAAQVERLLADARSAAFIGNFFGQWLELRKLESMRPDPELFPDFSSELRADLAEETLRFAGDLVRNNRPAIELLTGKHSFANQRIARFYGLGDQAQGNDDYVRIDLEGTHRRGILTQGSILFLTSYPNRTSPTRRGNWILTTILGDEPPPPPPGVPELEENEAVEEHLTLREQLVQHRVNPTCVSCHETMDAIGFGFENFDAIGRWREMDGNHPVDSGGTLPTGESFANAGELIDLLAGKEGAFVSHLASRLLTYALGRGTEYYDRIAIETMVENSSADGHRFRDLIREVVLSRPFRMTSNEPHAEAQRRRE